LTKELPLDFFVLFSSAASLLGSRGQANHAAANAFLDGFVHYRKAHGLPAQSINWGAWSEIGAAADLVRTQQQQMAAQGMGFIPPEQGIAAFAHLLKQSATQVGVVPIMWNNYLAGSAGLRSFYAEFIPKAVQTANQETTAVASQPMNARQQLEAAEEDERHELLMQHLRTATAKVLGLRSPEQINARDGLMDMGLDSLMAIELRNSIGRSLDLQLPFTIFFDYPTLEAVEAYLSNEIWPSEAGANEHEDEHEGALLTSQIEDQSDDDDFLSDDEVEASIAEELELLNSFLK
jgi:myxalamid-type polyketide synthase MxaB